MKKITSLLIALVLVLSMSVIAMAYSTSIDWSNCGWETWGKETINYDGASSWARAGIEQAFNGGFLDYEVIRATFMYDPNEGKELGEWEYAGRTPSEEEQVAFIDRAAFANKTDFTKPITRREFAQLVVMWVMQVTGEKPKDLTDRMNAGKTKYFIDTIKDYDSLLSYAYYFGIVSGTGNDGVGTTKWKGTDTYTVWEIQNFYASPDALLTREQAATMIMRAVKFVNLVGHVDDTPRKYPSVGMGIDPDFAYTIRVQYEDQYKLNMDETHATVRAASNTADQGFADISTASSWATDAINFCKANGIMNGTGGNNFSPKANYTIEQAIMTFSNIK